MSKTAFTLTMKSNAELEKSVRKTWAFMPATKFFKSKKDYNRHEHKRMVERNIRLGLD